MIKDSAIVPGNNVRTIYKVDGNIANMYQINVPLPSPRLFAQFGGILAQDQVHKKSIYPQG